MSINVSFVNMKGGVGKTTLAMQFALAAQDTGLKALAVDLDPQSNLSQGLLGPKRYVELLKNDEPTVIQIFERYSPATRAKPSPTIASVDEVIKKSINGHFLDLIPSRFELCH